MTPPIAITFLLVAVFGGVVALTREPTHQAIAMIPFGLALAAQFYLLRAPDVALSQIVVGAATIPTLILLAVQKTRAPRGGREERR